MIKLILKLGVVALIVLTLLSWFNVIEVDSEETPVVATCPEGSYEIGRKEEDGEPICKLEPTGCPYGDSIPVDSPKCVAPSEPDRDYHDEWGNRWSSSGEFEAVGSCSPVNGKHNPRCPEPEVVTSSEESWGK